MSKAETAIHDRLAAFPAPQQTLMGGAGEETGRVDRQFVGHVVAEQVRLAFVQQVLYRTATMPALQSPAMPPLWLWAGTERLNTTDGSVLVCTCTVH